MNLIRKMNVSDIFQVVEIEKNTLKNTLGEEFIYEELTMNPFAYYYVYVINNEVIGYIGTRFYDDVLEIMNFVVTEKNQNKGYGQQLFDYALNQLNSAKRVLLEVRKSNTKAKRFYLKNGFKKSHIRKDYYIDEDAIVYIKEV